LLHRSLIEELWFLVWPCNYLLLWNRSFNESPQSPLCEGGGGGGSVILANGIKIFFFFAYPQNNFSSTLYLQSCRYKRVG
jgi:hypothetical protein